MGSGGWSKDLVKGRDMYRKLTADPDWRNKFGTACEAFHVPLPSLAFYGNEMARAAEEAKVKYAGGVHIPNVKIKAHVEKLQIPKIRFRD